MDESFSCDSFLEGAKKAAHRAMNDHGRREYDEFALHAGVTVEKLAKAVLVSKSPVYIAEIRNNSADMVMHLGGHIQVDEAKVRTVGAAEAIKRLQKIGVLEKDPQLDLLIEMRNGAAHASPDSTLAKGMISPLAQTVETLLNVLGKPLNEFWERWTDAVNNAVNEQEDLVLRDVQLRITQARHAFEDRFAGMPDLKAKAVSGPQPIERQWHPVPFSKGGNTVLLTTGGTCPSCEATVELLFELIERTVEGETFSPKGIRCSLCELEVYGDDEMAALRKINNIPRMAIIDSDPENNIRMRVVRGDEKDD
jgi:hypothetical protein